MYNLIILALALAVSLQRTHAFLAPHRGKGDAPTLASNCHNYRQLFSISIAASSKNNGADQEDDTTTSRFPDDLVESLDILPLLEAVSLHAGTRRGRQAFLALAGASYDEIKPESRAKPKTSETMSARSRRALGEMDASSNMQSDEELKKHFSQKLSISVAGNEREAKDEYSLVAEALELLSDKTDSSYPPLYGLSSSPWDTETVAETDYDSFLRTSMEASTLEHIIHAEKVIETIRNVKEWARCDLITEKAPELAELAASIDLSVLDVLYEEITETVVIKRVRTVTDPNGRSSFRFELNADKFHVVQVLRKQVEEMAEKVTGKGKNSQQLESDLSVLVEKLEDTEGEIQTALFQSTLGRSKEIDSNLNILARLDVIFAKAAFGESTGGMIPLIKNEGEIAVKQFVHPVLLLSENGGDAIVSIDLRLSSEAKHRALIISGPNGGGKTAAMKSFGLTALLCKLGLPIPCRRTQDTTTQRPRVDYFRDIYTALGDRQSLMDGESTMMARLNECASVIENVGFKREAGTASLVLIDEIGGGTDPDAGGAIAQAILEKLLETKSCRIVATTHVPRLKVLSYESDQFGCATVLLEASTEENGTASYQKPAYELLYDSIGDSYVLGAASRCAPALPGDVISRAAQLMTATSSPDGTSSSSSSIDGAYLQVLTDSIKRQSERAQSARLAAESYEQDSAACRRAMVSVASAYDREFLFLQQKIEDVYSKLKASEEDSFDIIGDTLGELRLVRKEVKSKTQLLKEKGLKLLPDWHDLVAGDSVVVVSEDDMNGVSATVHHDIGSLSLGPDDVAVIPSLSAWEGTYSMPEVSDETGAAEGKKSLILKRYQIAIWDYDSMWDEDSDSGSAPGGAQATSVKDSKRRLNDILVNIKSSPPSRNPAKSGTSSSSSSSSSDSDQKQFTSSRDRKASAKKSAKSTKKQRKR